MNPKKLMMKCYKILLWIWTTAWRRITLSKEQYKTKYLLKDQAK
jgi:hypothetical protein